ncbi:MAG TPA: DegV family protein, partial [Streptosporangiales bacterium]
MTAGDGGVAVVTDSTAYLPDQLVYHHGITVVPLQVTVDGNGSATPGTPAEVTGDDGADVTAHDVAEALRARRRVTTSR